LTARPVLQQAGFAGTSLDVALGVSWAESGGYSDAVGDWKIVDPSQPEYSETAAAKWGPSIGIFQVRSLKHPHIWGAADSHREVFALRNVFYNAVAAYAISKQGTDWTPWTVYRTGSYLPHIGKDYVIQTGHAMAAKWRLGIVMPAA
jgi:hypothetical protein